MTLLAQLSLVETSKKLRQPQMDERSPFIFLGQPVWGGIQRKVRTYHNLRPFHLGCLYCIHLIEYNFAGVQ